RAIAQLALTVVTPAVDGARFGNCACVVPARAHLHVSIHGSHFRRAVERGRAPIAELAVHAPAPALNAADASDPARVAAARVQLHVKRRTGDSYRLAPVLRRKVPQLPLASPPPAPCGARLVRNACML